MQSNISAQSFNYIHIIRVLAIVLITNSHFKLLLPQSLQFFASGGAAGCALFFFCSGYTLQLGKKGAFFKWIFKRYMKIYPALWIFLLLEGVLLKGCVFQPIDFIIPSYWFLQAILLFYLPFYFISKYLSNYLIPIIGISFLTILPIYFIGDHSKWFIDYVYSPNYIHLYYYWGIMLFGSYLAKQKQEINENRGTLYLAASICLFFILYAVKFVGTKYSSVTDIQLIFPIILCFMVYYTYKATYCLANQKIPPAIKKTIYRLSNQTLCIYICQFAIITLSASILFPLGLVVACAGILLMAFILQYTSNIVSEFIIKSFA